MLLIFIVRFVCKDSFGVTGICIYGQAGDDYHADNLKILSETGPKKSTAIGFRFHEQY